MTDSASVLKELRKLPENKICMDCTDKMPSFVCLELGTFVCTSCAGIHREFGHHIKSVTLSIFTPEEVELVAAGGNQNAKKIWLAKWTPSVFAQPGPTDKATIREFIKLKYVDKLWYAMPSSPLAVPENKTAAVSNEINNQATSPTNNSLAVDPVDQYKSPFETPKVNPVDSSVSWRANFDQFDAAVNKLNKSLDILEIQEQSAKTPNKPVESQYQHQSGDLITFDLLTGAVPPKPQEQQPQTQYIVREQSPPTLNQSQGESNQVQSPQNPQYIVKEQPPQYIQQPQQSPQPSPSNQRVASPPSPSTTYQQMTQQSPPMMPQGVPMPQMVSNYPYGTQFMSPQMMPPMMQPMGAMPMPVYLNQFGQPMPMPPMGAQPMPMPMPPMGAQPMIMGPNGVPMMLAPGNPKATQGGMPQPIIVNQYGQPVTLPPGVQPIPIMLPPGAQPPGSWISRPNPQQQINKPAVIPQSNHAMSDYELAKKLQEEENKQANSGAGNNKKPSQPIQPSQPSKPAFKPMSDEEYARRLQEEENTKGGGGGNSGYKTTPSVTNPGRGAYFKSDEELARQLAQEDEEDD
jgi:hypothetical protein